VYKNHPVCTAYLRSKIEFVFREGEKPFPRPYFQWGGAEGDTISNPLTHSPRRLGSRVYTALKLGAYGACEAVPPFANLEPPLFDSHASFLGNDPWYHVVKYICVRLVHV